MEKYFTKRNTEKKQNKINFLIISFLLIAFFFSPLYNSQAAINKQINYQGKLTLASGVAVSNGTYAMEFKLYTVDTGGTAIWTETRTVGDEVQVTNGLFSVMLGEIATLASVDFNQTLYLGVKIEADNEMTPRKKLGAVPAAVEAEKALKANNLVGGNSTTLLGAMPYQSDVDTSTLLGPNTTTTKKFLRMTGTGTNGAVPAWDTLADADIPSALTGKTYNGLTITANGTNTLNIAAGQSLIVTTGGTLGSNAYTSTLYLPLAGGTMTGGITNSTSVNPLTTLAESWIGPSSTAGIYFKGGNVGIGTTAPGALLHIVSSGVANNLKLDSSGGGITGMSLATLGIIKGYWAVPSANNNYFTDALVGDMVFRSEVNRVLFGVGVAASTMQVSGTGVNITGKVGIGTTGPNAKLDVADTNVVLGTPTPGNVLIRTTNAYGANIGGSLSLGGAYGTGVGFEYGSFAKISGRKSNGTLNNLDGYLAFEVSNDSAAPYIFERMRITGGGNVGIGTTAPGYALQIGDGTGTNKIVKITSESGDMGIRMMETTEDTNGFSVLYDANNRFKILRHDGSQAGTEVLSILRANGNVGIGTITPTAVLHLKAGTATINTAPLKFTSGTNLTTAETGAMEYDGTNLYFTPSGTTRKTVAYTDSVLTSSMYIGTTSVPLNRTSGALTLAGITLTTPEIGAATGTSLDLGGTTLYGSRAITVDTGGVLNVDIGSAAGDDFTVDTNKLVVEGDTGNVGIGTATPSYKLDVRDTLAGGLAIQSVMTATSGSGSYAIKGVNQSTAGTAYGVGAYALGAATKNVGLYVTASGATTNYAAIFYEGSVGIGTADPTQELDLIGDLELETTTSNDTGVIYKGTNRFIHNFALAGTTGGNTFVGIDAGNFTMTGSTGSQGSYNTGIGSSALAVNTTGYQNTAVGNSALYSNTTGNGNTAIGRASLYSNTTGFANTAVGDSLEANTTGSGNTAIGNGALQSNTTGGTNTAIGNGALQFNTTGQSNTAIGYGALGDLNITNSDYGDNTAIGTNTGLGIVTGINNTIIGANVGGLAATLSNNIIIADGAGNQRINVDSTGNVGIGTTSPGAKLDLRYNTGLGLNWGSTSAKMGILDYNTGVAQIYSSSGNRLQLGSNGSITNGITINTAGNVGIGTTTPGAKLDVAGLNTATVNGAALTGVNFSTTSNYGAYTGIDDVVTRITATNATQIGLVIKQAASPTVNPFELRDSTNAMIMRVTSSGAIAVPTVYSPNGYNAIGLGNGTDMTFQTNNAERMRILYSNGNVGIGTTGPAKNLEVRGSSLPEFRIGSTQDTAEYGSLIFDRTGTSKLTLSTNIAGSNIYLTPSATGNVIINQGKVGIGTTAPTARLHVYQNDGNPLEYKLESPTYNGYVGQHWINDSGFGEIWRNASARNDGSSENLSLNIYNSNGPISFWANGTKYMDIRNDGKVGIGTTAPGTMLTVGTVTTNTGNITVYGTGTTCTIGNGTGATNCTSDIRLKDNITTLESELENIMALRPVSFNWKDPSRNQIINTGLIAQEVQNIYPNMVHVVYDDYLGIDYAALVVPTIKAVQEMNLKLEDLSSLDITSPTSLGSLIKTFLADVGNGIENLYASVIYSSVIYSDRIETEMLCVGSTCVTEEQFLEIVNKNVTTSSPIVNPEPDPGPEPNPETPTCIPPQILEGDECVTPIEETPTTDEISPPPSEDDQGGGDSDTTEGGVGLST